MGLWAGHLQLAKERAKVVSGAQSAEGLWASRLPVPAAGLGPSTAASNPRAGFRDLQRQKIEWRGRGPWPLGSPFNFRIDLGVQEEALFRAEPVVSVLFRLRAACLPEEWEQLEEERCAFSSLGQKVCWSRQGTHCLCCCHHCAYCFLGQKARALC